MTLLNDEMVEKAARAMDDSNLLVFCRVNKMAKPPCQEICRYGEDGEEEIVVLERIGLNEDARDLMDAMILEARARAALEAVVPDVVEEWRETVEDLVTQFAASSAKDGRYAITTAGLSALEGGFAMLGWDDPHPMPEAECEQAGCHKEATCGTPTPDGYKRLCGDHWTEIRSLWKGE